MSPRAVWAQTTAGAPTKEASTRGGGARRRAALGGARTASGDAGEKGSGASPPAPPRRPRPRARKCAAESGVDAVAPGVRWAEGVAGVEVREAGPKGEGGKGEGVWNGAGEEGL